MRAADTPAHALRSSPAAVVPCRPPCCLHVRQAFIGTHARQQQPSSTVRPAALRVAPCSAGPRFLLRRPPPAESRPLFLRGGVLAAHATRSQSHRATRRSQRKVLQSCLPPAHGPTPPPHPHPAALPAAPTPTHPAPRLPPASARHHRCRSLYEMLERLVWTTDVHLREGLCPRGNGWLACV